jgi:hypothetical protein
MKPFHTIAVPAMDILEGKLTMDVFAADLWDTYLGRSPAEYKDARLFFKKTYQTEGLKNLLSVVEKRLKGEGGDPVIQIQTPFGGGKTHALIAMYHNAKQWNANPVVIVGTALNPNEDTLWGVIEKQLTGTNKTLTEKVSPGREALRKLLLKHQPVMILMDEVLEYVTKAAGVPVKETSLASQTIAFIQELTEVASTLEKVCVIVTLPSSILEHYDEKAEKLFQQIQKVAGRVEKIYTPVQENEITKIIRRRLFSSVDEVESKYVVSEFLEYAEREGILPPGREVSDYRDKFIDSYPLSPEVIEVLYHRWGSLPTFQRTRGVLRLLSLVIFSLRESARPYLTLSDFDLENAEVRRELVKHIGPEFDSVIAADISSPDSGAKKVDVTVGKSFRGLRLGSRAATSIFLYSFSGGQEKGALIGEIKRSATTTENPSSVVAEAVEQLKSKLFYLQTQNEKYFFLNQPNLNRILLTKMENVKDKDVSEFERGLLRHHITGGKIKVFVWPDKPRDIPDSEELKLVVMIDRNEPLMKNIIDSRGESPRVYRNTIFFLVPSETEKVSFINLMKRKIAYEQILVDKTLNLTEEQKHEVSVNLKREEEGLTDAVKRCYRLAFAPAKDGLKQIDLGIPTYGENKGLDEEVFEQLRSEQEILEKISPLIIREKYLKDRDYAKLDLIYDSMLKTPGERRVVSPSVIEESIKQGVRQGLFGIGELSEGDKITCRAFKEEALITFGESEVIIKDSACVLEGQGQTPATIGPSGVIATPGGEQQPTPLASKEIEGKRGRLWIEFEVPRGRVSQVMGVMNFLQSKFRSLRISIKATDGSLSDDEYSSKIKEALKQLGIEIDENLGNASNQ